MSRATALSYGRRASEASMVDTCTIRRSTGTGNGATDGYGNVVDNYVNPDPYTGKCRVQQGQLSSSTDRDVGEDQVVLLSLEVQIPMSVIGLQVGDEVHMTTSRSDPDLPGRVFLIASLAHKTDATARRLQCTERTD